MVSHGSLAVCSAHADAAADRVFAGEIARHKLLAHDGHRQGIERVAGVKARPETMGMWKASKYPGLTWTVQSGLEFAGDCGPVFDRHIAASSHCRCRAARSHFGMGHAGQRTQFGQAVCVPGRHFLRAVVAGGGQSGP